MNFLLFFHFISSLMSGWHQHHQATARVILAFGPIQSWWSPPPTQTAMDWWNEFFQPKGPFVTSRNISYKFFKDKVSRKIGYVWKYQHSICITFFNLNLITRQHYPMTRRDLPASACGCLGQFNFHWQYSLQSMMIKPHKYKDCFSSMTPTLNFLHVSL